MLGAKDSCEHQTLSQTLIPGFPVNSSVRRVPDQVSRPVLTQLTSGQGLRVPKERKGTKKPVGFMERHQKSKRLMYRIERQKGEGGAEELLKGIAAENSAWLGKGNSSQHKKITNTLSTVASH